MGSKSLLVVVTGTGTEIGKTHVASALLSAWSERQAVVGYKPIETGVPRSPARGGGVRDGDARGEDARSLAQVSTFHVKPRPFAETFVDPISPHLAARRARRRIDLGRIVRQARALAIAAEGVVVELAGGLFTPLGPGVANADLALRLRPSRVVLVAPDRLGVLHDVSATLRAARALRLRIDGVVLSAPAAPDASTGTNRREIERVLGARVLAEFPRAAGPKDPSTRTAGATLVRSLELARRDARL